MSECGSKKKNNKQVKIKQNQKKNYLSSLPLSFEKKRNRIQNFLIQVFYSPHYPGGENWPKAGKIPPKVSTDRVAGSYYFPKILKTFMENTKTIIKRKDGDFHGD